MKLTLLCMALALALVDMAAGKGCCTPDQWEGLNSAEVGYTRLGRRSENTKIGINRFDVDDDAGLDLDGGLGRRRTGFYRTVYYMFYDYTNTQSAAYANVTAGRYRRNYFILKKYSGGENASGQMYVVDLAKDKCYQKELKYPFRQACIPDKAKAFDNTYFGAGDNTLEVTPYFLLVKGKRYGLEITPTVTAEGCIPVAQGMTGVVRKTAFMSMSGFVDIKAGISDPSVFDVPESCQKDVGVAAGEEFDMLLNDEYSVVSPF